MSYLHKHDHTFAQNFTDAHFVIVVALEDLLFQKLASGLVEGFTGPVEPAAIKPLLTFTHQPRDAHISQYPKMCRIHFYKTHHYLQAV